MSDLLSILEFSSSVTAPIFLLLGMGVWLRRIGVLADAFVTRGDCSPHIPDVAPALP